LTQLAEASALSKFHLPRLFAETFGATPLGYAQLRRVERAKDLLRSDANGTKTLKLRE
jgi:AraC-like DNA-binding protein